MAQTKKPRLGRKPAVEVLPGMMFGHLRVLQKVNTKPGSNGGQRYRFECTVYQGNGVRCGNRLTLPVFYVKRPNPKTHCGCLNKKADPQVTYTKVSWQAMHLRCEYTKHVAYKDYGGRGITIDPRWHKDNPDGFINFVKDMGLRPKGLSLDRENPNGHYTKSNCRWATSKVQSNNQRRHYPPGEVAPLEFFDEGEEDSNEPQD